MEIKIINDLLFVIWKMTQGWDEEKVAADKSYSAPESGMGMHRLGKSYGKQEAGQQIRELLTAAGYKHKEG